MTEDHTTRICLWASPRNISTALMYSFAQRTDTQVVDEPFYGYYLSQTKAKAYHPGAEEIIHSMENNGNRVIKKILGTHDKPVVFFKNMTHHQLNLDKSFTRHVVNIILTRNPVEMICSFSRVVARPTMKDIGYQDQVDLLNYLKKTEAVFMVIDSSDILRSPQKALKKICKKANIEFSKAMLSWESGDRSEDGVWAKYWYDNVHRSKGFEKYQLQKSIIPSELSSLADQCAPLYGYLQQHFESIQ